MATVTLAPATTPTVPAAVRNHVWDGMYTLVYKNGSYFTFKVETVKSGALKDKRIVSFLAGPDNTTDYQGFAFLDPQTNTLSVWKRFRNGGMMERAGHLNLLFTMPERLGQAGLDYALRSGRCRRCGRTLTVPASLHAGLGPECRAKMGVA